MSQELKAKYKTVGPRKEMVTFVKRTYDSKAKKFKEVEVTEEKTCWTVYFPQKHSVRFTNFEELKRMGYHLKPRIVDMATGDIVDIGGDPYDFGESASGVDASITLED